MPKIAIIPARGGSKRIPRKNVKDFLGRPIVAYSIEAALESGVFDEVMVSTDDQEIADISMRYGAKVPFFRSPKTSTDMAMTVPVLLEVLEEYRRSEIDFEYGCCIYPCAPFVASERLKRGMELLISEKVDSVLPVLRFSYPPLRGLTIRNKKLQMLFPENYNARSQDLEPIYHDAGQFYCFRTDALVEQKTLFCKNTLPLELSEMEAQDIDTMDDWKMAERKYTMACSSRGKA
ncbi:MAG: pseudaminic acid cytidylyltransferase [Holosporaceae bacterium]|jgi:N-acylneuraminate cytidylyltransferase|nr:pseudaminic acid cytidylyltransferase [Holosporaceae bacterium]